jgi:hypothetical protein
MPDTTVEQSPAAPYDPPLGPRVSRLEDQMSDLKPILARIEAILPHLATAAQVAELRGDIDLKLARLSGEFDTKLERLAGSFDTKLERFAGSFDARLERFAGDFNARLERLTGRVESLPTTWQMLTAIIAGQVTLAGLLCAAVFGAGRLSGHW